MAKRTLDLLVCFPLLFVLIPVFVLIALAIKISDSGPVLYRGVRTGRYGTPFRIIKFRTMVVGAENIGGGTTAQDDPRIFLVGRFLRRYKLDELPQIINVLAGEMSLVGPRPELPQYTSRYDAAQKTILSVKPGITDYSSIQFSSLDEVVGSRDADRVFEELVLPEKNRLRVHYVQTCSFWVDLKIIMFTFWCLLAKPFR